MTTSSDDLRPGVQTRGISHPPHRTVDRVVGILEAVSRSGEGGLALPEIARLLDAPKSSIQGLVYGLVAAGYLIVGEDYRYLAGPGAYTLTSAAGAAPWTVDEGMLEDLAARTGCIALVAIRFGQHAMYVNRTGESELFSYYAAERIRRPMLTSAAGKMMLSMFNDERLHDFLRRRPAADADDIERLLIELPSIRRLGYSYSSQGSIPGVDAIATPIAGGEAFEAVAVLSWETGSLDRTAAELAEILMDDVAKWLN